MNDEWWEGFGMGVLLGFIGLILFALFVVGPDFTKMEELGGCKNNFFDGQDACKYHNPNENRYRLENGTIVTINGNGR